MKILVINAGSSSLKYQLIDMDGEKVIAKGNCERIGIDGKISHKAADGREYKAQVPMATHTDAFRCVELALVSGPAKVLGSMKEIDAVGHRIVQGGSIFSESVLVTPEIIDQIEGLSDLAPLHNPAHVQGLRACSDLLPDVPQVVVFDTAFHQTMPPKAYMYALPYEYYEKYKIRRYGFHGTSHRFVSAKAANMLGKDLKDLKMITCHLGNGSSITAIDGGRVVDTSMGFTPLDGFMMGTRTGTLDPSVVTYIIEKENKSWKELTELFNKKSGLLGISGISSDDRDIDNAIEEGSERAKLARDMMYYQITKFIGSYIAALGGVDVIAFTGGIGENSKEIREHVASSLAYMGVKLNGEANDQFVHGREGVISTEDSSVTLMVVMTDEEKVIARDTKAIVESLQK